MNFAGLAVLALRPTKVSPVDKVTSFSHLS